jgi:hypothetical protein
MKSSVITDETVITYNAELWREATEKHGSKYRVPEEEMQRMGELVRGLHVLQVWQSRGGQGNPVKFLAEYNVSNESIEVLAASFLGNQKLLEVLDEKHVKRANKWKTLEDWAKNNTYEEVTTEQIMEVCGFSNQTVLNYAKTSPYFKKVQRGRWEVRDPKEDRAREKNA